MTGTTRRQNQRNLPEDAPSLSAANTRVNAPHVAASTETAGAAPSRGAGFDEAGIEVVATMATPDSQQADGPRPEQLAAATVLVQQVRAQAGQLAAHLRRQQAAIDHREAEVNARIGAMDRDLRAARLWLSEQRQAIDAERAELEQRRQQLFSRNSELSRQHEGAAKHHDEIQNMLRRRESELETRESVLASRLSEMAASESDAQDALGRQGAVGGAGSKPGGARAGSRSSARRKRAVASGSAAVASNNWNRGPRDSRPKKRSWSKNRLSSANRES